MDVLGSQIRLQFGYFGNFWPLFPKKLGEILFNFLVTLMATPDSLDRTGHVNTFLSTN